MVKIKKQKFGSFQLKMFCVKEKTSKMYFAIFFVRESGT